jgi:hypothetical protein
VQITSLEQKLIDAHQEVSVAMLRSIGVTVLEIVLAERGACAADNPNPERPP